MAIYHLRLKVHSRALGRDPRPGGATRRSAVAAAAYRSGEALYDIAQGKTFQYEKPDVVHKEIMIPEGAQVGDWVFDRASLWNMVEKAEKRVDAQFAREIEITLPRELTHDQQVALVRSFVRDHFCRLGMVADIAIHRPKAVDGQDQPHAHVLLTLRRLDQTTVTGFSAKKERDWNETEAVAREVAEARKVYNNSGLDEDLERLEAAEAKRNVNIWRASWAEYANRVLEEAGSESRIDHRTLEKQGIFLLPEIALGIARHIEKIYDHIKTRITQWNAIRKRASLYRDVEVIRGRDPGQLAEFVLRLHDIADAFTAQYRHSEHGMPPPDVGHTHSKPNNHENDHGR